MQYCMHGRVDLAAAIKVVVNEPAYPVHVLVPLGFACQLPWGYEAELTARSSLYKKHRCILTNGVGIIDNTYCGDNDQWYASLLFFGPTTIEKGERIVQFRIVKEQEPITFESVDSLDNPDRGGFGSTDQ